MDRPHLDDIGVCNKGVYSIGQPADQQILLEKIHYLLMHGGIQTLTGKELLMHHIDGKPIKPVCQQKLLKIQREHALDLNTPDGDRGGLLQGHAQQRPAGNIGVPVVLLQKLEHGQQVRIRLDLIKENQRVFLLSHSLAGDRADLKIKVLDGADLLKQPGAVVILRKVQLDIVLKELLPNVAYNKRLSDLPRPVDNQHLIGIGFQIAFNIRLDFSI